jgi:hypothetical protein
MGLNGVILGKKGILKEGLSKMHEALEAKEEIRDKI